MGYGLALLRKQWLNELMKRTLLFLALGLLVMNLTSGCNKSDDTTPPAVSASTNEVSTNTVSTNTPATH
jgi:hypothetical protein